MLNRHNSATVQRIAMKVGTVTHFNPLKPTHVPNFEFLKIQQNEFISRNGGRTLLKNKIVISQ